MNKIHDLLMSDGDHRIRFLLLVDLKEDTRFEASFISVTQQNVAPYARLHVVLHSKIH